MIRDETYTTHMCIIILQHVSFEGAGVVQVCLRTLLLPIDTPAGNEGSFQNYFHKGMTAFTGKHFTYLRIGETRTMQVSTLPGLGNGHKGHIE